MKSFLKRASVIAFALIVFLTGCELSHQANTENEDGVASEFTDNTSKELSQVVSQEESDTLEESDASEESSAYIPSDDELVLIKDYIPDIALDIRYATVNNFTGKIIYDSADAYLRYGTVKKLVSVQSELKSKGFKILVWDAYRPTEAQWKLWEICPDPSFVSDPNKGFSGHSKGNTVDITLAYSDGTPVEMPCEFDEFGLLADRDYSDTSATAAENARLLEDTMLKNGFTGYSKEWWHYSDTVKYDVVIE